MKITVIGGGSYGWAFRFVQQLVHSEPLQGTVLTLMDIKEEPLALIRKAADIYNAEHGQTIRVESTLSLERALEGADFVFITISTGGLKTMQVDVEVPRKYGIWHPVGDTTGPGGWNRAMRNIPVFYDLAEKAKRLCPNAWIFNFSNPLSVLTRVPHKYFGMKTIGMCHGVVGNAQRLLRLAGLGPNARLDYVTTGLDHVSWFTRLYADGVDVLARLKELGFCRSDGKMPKSGKDQDAFVGNVESAAANFAVWRELGYMSAISDRHAVETWPWFIVHESDEETYHVKRTTIAERAQNYADAKARLERYVSGEHSLFSGDGHGNDPAIGIVEALCGFRSFEFSANYRNIGQIPGFPEDCVVETRCFFDRAGVHPLTSPMPDLLKAIVVPHALRQEVSVDIAMHGTFDELVALVTTDPLCCRLPMGKCSEMVKEMLLGTKDYIRNPRLLEF